MRPFPAAISARVTRPSRLWWVEMPRHWKRSCRSYNRWARLLHMLARQEQDRWRKPRIKLWWPHRWWRWASTGLFEESRRGPAQGGGCDQGRRGAMLDVGCKAAAFVRRESKPGLQSPYANKGYENHTRNCK